LLTIKYNKARLLEDTNRQEEAVALYTEIVQDQTKYIDGILPFDETKTWLVAMC